MASDALITLIIDAKNLASAQVKGLQRDLKGINDEGARTDAVMKRSTAIVKGGLALAFGAAAKGAADLANVQAQLQAETGASADEAHRMALAVNGIAGATRQSLPAVQAAMSKVRTDLGLAGDEAEAATRRFVDFARVTGQDAAGAVSAFDDILDSWGLTAAQGNDVMDKLVVSHQKYGGTVAQNEAALAALAPMLRGMNVGIDDAIGLLNLFQTTGMDATGATRALTKAITMLKPGQTLDDLIASISSIEDPTERAQRAIELFGARGGANLANALRPGIGSLDDFAISATDAAGAVDEAATAIDSTFPATIKRVFSEAQAALRGFGDGFGTSIMTLASAASMWSMFAGAVGISMTGALTAALKGAWSLAGKAAVPDAAFAGTLEGGAAGTAAGGAMQAGLLSRFATGLGGLITKTLLGAVGAGVAALAAGIELSKAIKEASGQSDQEWLATTAETYKRMGGLSGYGGMTSTGQSVGRDTNWTEGWQYAGEQAAAATGAGIVAGKQDMSTGFSEAVQAITPEMERAARIAARRAGAATAQSVADGITAARQAPVDAFDRLKEMLANAMTPKQERARLMGQLHSKALAAGLKSGDPAVRAQAEALRDTIKARLEELKPKAKTDGQTIAENLAKGLTAGAPAIATSVAGLGEVISDYLRVRSPARRGPLSKDGGPEGFGKKFGRLYGQGLASAAGAVAGASDAVAGSVRIGAAVGAASGAGAAGGVHLHVHTAYPPTKAQIAQMADDLDAELRARFARFSPYVVRS